MTGRVVTSTAELTPLLVSRSMAPIHDQSQNRWKSPREGFASNEVAAVVMFDHIREAKDSWELFRRLSRRLALAFGSFEMITDFGKCKARLN
jgi:hypothetical protein